MRKKSLEKADCWSPRNRVYGMRQGDVIEVFQCYDSSQICDYIRRVDYLFGFQSFIMNGQILNTKVNHMVQRPWRPEECEFPWKWS